MNKVKDGFPCPKCPSSDAFKVKEDTGWGHCFSCGDNFSPEVSEKHMNELNNIVSTKPKLVGDTVSKASPPITPVTTVFRPFAARGFTEDTIRRYKVDVGSDQAEYVAKYPLYDLDGNHIANKVRLPDKGFFQEGEFGALGLFGRHAFPPGSAKCITVVEGQDDALAAYQLMGSKYPVVSIHSAVTAERDVRKDFEYLNSFDQIVFCFDNDEHGRKAAKACAGAGFPLGKIKVLNLRRHKDANDYLLAKEAEAFTKEWWGAPIFRPDGLKFGSETLDDILNKPNQYTVQYPWDSLNRMTYGLRLSELVLLMADTGAGKTTIMKEMAYSFLMNKEVKESGYGVGFLHLEETVTDTALGLMSIHDSKPYHLPDCPKTAEELTKSHAEVFADNRAILYDSFGSNEVDVIINKVRHMAAMGCKYFFLDHLSIIVSDQSGDERKDLDEISTKLKTLTIELDIAIVCVIHTNRQGMARGSAGPEKVCNLHLHILRDKEDADEWRRNVIKLVIKKNRFCGRTGPAMYLWYNPETGRLMELSDEEQQRYDTGGTIREDEQW